MTVDKQKEEQELYSDFLNEYLNGNNQNVTPKPELPTDKPSEKVKSEFIPKIESPENYPKPNQEKTVNEINENYDQIEMSDLPLSDFYYTNTKIYFRDLKVKEIEHFSTLSDDNLFDFKDKLNEVLDAATIFVHPDGRQGTYQDIKDGDRIFLIYTIRERTFLRNKSKVLSVNVKYKEGKETKETNIPLLRANLDIYRDEDILSYFDEDTKSLKFETDLRDEPFLIAPPTIGLKRCFDSYLRISHSKKKKINTSFFKIAPFLHPHTTYMSYQELVGLQDWFENDMNIEEFSFLEDLINNHLRIGVRGLKKNMDGREIRTNKVYPERLRTIFVLQNAFSLFLKKQT